MPDLTSAAFPVAPPIGWRRLAIGDAIEPISRPIQMRDHEEYRLISVRRRFGGLFDRERLLGRQIRTKNLESLEPGAFILARMQIVHGACAKVAEEMRGGAVSKSYVQFVGREGTEIGFFARLAQTPEMLKLYMDASQGVVIEKMTFDLKRWLGFEVNLPPLPEQRRIAEILDTVDEALRKTEEIIAKLEQVKQGLLHDLLTRGIDDNGELRDPDRHPEQFKDSPLGRIPTEWECDTLGSVSRPRQWPTISQSQLTQQGYPVFGANGFIGYYHEYNHEHPTVAVTCRGATCGNVHVTPSNAYITGNAMALDDLSSKISAAFLSAQLAWRGMNEVITGSAQPQIVGSAIRQVRIVLPPCGEQRRIVDCLRRHQQRETTEKSWLGKLAQTKKALMEDLLTGRVRVTALLEASE